MSSVAFADRIAGCLLGGAIGDAIGSYFEGRSASTFFVPDVLQITDDTQLTLATCEAILAAGRVDPEVVASHFLVWFRERRLTGLGASTLKSLIELDAGGHWALVGATGDRAAGNGSAMRIAPLAFVLDPELEADRQIVRDVARISHRHEEAYVGALAMVRAIRHAFKGNSIDRALLAHLATHLPDSCVRDRFVEVNASAMSVEAYSQKYGSSGYVVDSVPLAVLAATTGQDFLTQLGEVISCGGDADTNASMYGQIFGAAMGVHALPRNAIDRLPVSAAICDMAKAFATKFKFS